MNVSRWLATGTLVVVLAVGGCGDDGGPGGGELSQQEKQALANALTASGQLGGFGGFAAFAVQMVGEVGTMSAGASAALAGAVNEALRLHVAGTAAADYEGAVGFAVEFEYDVQALQYEGFFLGAVGWNGVNASAGTVDEMVVIGAIGDALPIPTSGSGSIEDGDVFAFYYDGSVTYTGTAGTATLNGSNFGGSATDCSQTYEGFTYECEVVIGNVNGDGEFEAINFQSEETFTQSLLNWNIPAVKLILRVTQTGS